MREIGQRLPGTWGDPARRSRIFYNSFSVVARTGSSTYGRSCMGFPDRWFVFGSAIWIIFVPGKTPLCGRYHCRPSGSSKALKTEYAHTMGAGGLPTTVIEVKG